MRAGGERKLVAQFLVTVLLLVGAVSCTDPPEPVAGDDGMPLPPDTVSEMAQRAVSGDNDAAETLSVHFGNLGNRIEQMKWLELAASRGSCNALEVALEKKYSTDEPQAKIDPWERLGDSMRCPYDRQLIRGFRPKH